MRTFLGIVLPLSVFLFAGYLWSVPGRDSVIVLPQRAEKVGAARTPLASAMPDYVAARQAANREREQVPHALDIEIPNSESGLESFGQPVGARQPATSRDKTSTNDVSASEASANVGLTTLQVDTAQRAAAADVVAAPTTHDAHKNESDVTTRLADILPKPATRTLWSRKAKSTGVRPHLLFVAIEDLNREDLGCYGQTLIRTPNIDRLALGGLRFTQFAGMSSGQTAQRTALLFGDLTTARAVGDERLVKLPQLSLPRMFSVSSYSTLLLGDCSWQLVDDPEQGHWLHYWGWHASHGSSTNSERTVTFAPHPEFALFDGHRVPVGEISGTASDELANVDEPDDGRDTARDFSGEGRRNERPSFDQSLLAQARQMTNECDPERPIAMFVALRLSWWNESRRVLPKYAATNWTTSEKQHASAVTAVDQLVGELAKLLDSAADRGPVATIVLGLPRERSRVELERFRASAPATTRRGGFAPDQVDAPTAAPLAARSFGPPVAVGHWPLAPAIITWPEHIRAGESEAGFTGYHDVLPTLATMIEARQMPLGRIMGTSHWKHWQVKD